MTSALVTIRFTSKCHIGSYIAGFLTQSRDFNHCMLLDGDTAYEAVPSGVRAVHVDVAMRGVKRYQDMQIMVEDIEAMRAFGCAQIGKGYDWLGAVGLPLLRSGDWQSDYRWWCSEHNFAMLGAGKTWLLDPTEQSWISPNDLHQCNYPKSRIIRL